MGCRFLSCLGDQMRGGADHAGSGGVEIGERGLEQMPCAEKAGAAFSVTKLSKFGYEVNGIGIVYRSKSLAELCASLSFSWSFT